jgi:hypothetical protein
MIQRKLFTTENTKDTEKMILLIQDIKKLRALRVLRGDCFDFFKQEYFHSLGSLETSAFAAFVPFVDQSPFLK